jgi:hypothetical protein
MPVVDDAPVYATAEPIGPQRDPSAPEPPRVVPAPLTPETEPGRDEARAAFVADATAGADGGADGPRVVREPTPDAPASAVYPARQVADLLTQLLDVSAQGLGPRFVGGSRELWTLAPTEREQVAVAATPVIDAYGLTQLSPEWALVAVLVAVYGPRAASAMAARDGDGSTS